MKILITGATGFIGKPLTDHLLQKGNSIIVLTRRARTSLDKSIKYVWWDPSDSNAIVDEIDGVDAIINLAGESVAVKRWTMAQKKQMLESRLNATKILVSSIEKAVQKPKVLINASAIGYYGSRAGQVLTEDSSKGEGFLADLAKQWEDEAMASERFGVRVVRLRIGMVLDLSGGALAKMAPVFRMGLGGWFGSGHQWVSWIHLKDLVSLIEFSLINQRVSGAVNAVSPQSITNRVFSMVLAQVVRRPCLFPVPAFVLKLFMGEVSEIVLASHRVVPQKGTSLGFSFQYPDIRSALEDIFTSKI